MIDLEEYRRKRPLVERLEAKDMELETERKRRIHLEAELITMEHEWSCPELEMTRVNKEVAYRIYRNMRAS